MSDGRLTTYSELAVVVENVPLLLRERRRALGLSLRAAGAVTGIGHSTIGRVESGEDFSTATLTVILHWLGTP